MKQIMVIDDDISIGNMLEEVLSKEGYQVQRAYSGTEAVMALSLKRPDLILLDLMLPGLTGEEILPRMKGIPVIVVSAKVNVDEKVKLLLCGAADYVTKPFDIKELLARIAVQFRKEEAQAEHAPLVFEEIEMDLVSRSVCVSGRPVKLTRTEYAILKLLMRNPSQVISKSLLLERISEETPDCVESSLKVHISHLRRKLREAGDRDYIEAVWGIGFKMREEPGF